MCVAMVSYFVVGLNVLREPRMVDNLAAATNYQRQRHGRSLAELFVGTPECICFAEGTAGAEIE